MNKLSLMLLALLACATVLLSADSASAVLCYPDTDGDGFGDAAVAGINEPSCASGFIDNNLDCNDANPSVHPGAPDICTNGEDDDCDGQVDEGLLWYADGDGDGYGDPSIAIEACDPPSGHVANGGDCDDTNPSVHPSAFDICGNGTDEDCDGDDGDLVWYFDSDWDGYGDPSISLDACNPPPQYVADGGDCDDNDPSIHPGAPDICGNGTDDDCDGAVDEGSVWYADADGDSYGDPSTAVDACSPPVGHVADDGDCNDADDSVHPGAPDICTNGVDDDCDSQVDEGLVWYADGDGDGFGDPSDAIEACDPPSGHVANGGDCDDSDPSVHPGATDICGNGTDEDCDGDDGESVWYFDGDGDGYGNPINALDACSPPPQYVADGGDCDDNDPSIHPGAPDICGNGTDDDCDGAVDEGSVWYADADGDSYGDPSTAVDACSPPVGHVADDGDCNDADDSVHPGAPDICTNGVDDDCDGQVDEGLVWYADGDGDGYGDPSIAIEACDPPSGHVANGGDCDDSDPSVHPGATDICGNGTDEDCDGDDGESVWYFDGDGDGYGNPINALDACSPPPQYVADGGDCDDNDPSIHPGAFELCDGNDQDCDGAIDDNCGACPVALTGDVNVSGTLTSADIIGLVNYCFKGGAAPQPCAAAGDVNCSGTVTSADVIGMVNHVFKGGPPPCNVCTMIPGTWSCP